MDRRPQPHQPSAHPLGHRHAYTVGEHSASRLLRSIPVNHIRFETTTGRSGMTNTVTSTTQVRTQREAPSNNFRRSKFRNCSQPSVRVSPIRHGRIDYLAPRRGYQVVTRRCHIPKIRPRRPRFIYAASRWPPLRLERRTISHNHWHVKSVGQVDQLSRSIDWWHHDATACHSVSTTGCTERQSPRIEDAVLCHVAQTAALSVERRATDQAPAQPNWAASMAPDGPALLKDRYALPTSQRPPSCLKAHHVAPAEHAEVHPPQRWQRRPPQQPSRSSLVQHQQASENLSPGVQLDANAAMNDWSEELSGLRSPVVQSDRWGRPAGFLVMPSMAIRSSMMPVTASSLRPLASRTERIAPMALGASRQQDHSTLLSPEGCRSPLREYSRSEVSSRVLTWPHQLKPVGAHPPSSSCVRPP